MLHKCFFEIESSPTPGPTPRQKASGLTPTHRTVYVPDSFLFDTDDNTQTCTNVTNKPKRAKSQPVGLTVATPSVEGEVCND